MGRRVHGDEGGRGGSERALTLGLWSVGAGASTWGAVAVAIWSAQQLPAGGATEPATVLLAAAGAACSLLLARLGLAASATAVALLLVGRPRRGADVHGLGRQRAGRIALAVSPAILRPLVALSLTGSLSLASAGSALASVPHPISSRLQVAAVPGPTLPDAGWPALPDAGWQALPDAGWRPTSPPPAEHRASDVTLVASGARAGTPTVRGPAAPGTQVVRRGDCLWSLAARHLGPGASDAQVAVEWRRWWAVNRPAIGSDPDMLRPGTRLTVPGRLGGTSR